MKRHSIILLSAIFFFINLDLNAQSILPKLQELFGAENVQMVDSSGFIYYYKIDIVQLVDHNDSTKGTFLNRILLGFNSTSSPIVMESAAYGIKGPYQNIKYKSELTELLDANQLIVEHRYFGTSIPDSTTFKYLTYKQVSDDFHYIRQKLNSIFPSKWIATGFSKGGDEVFDYKFYYPKDVDATVAYGISLTLEKEDNRFKDFLSEKKKTVEGKKIYELQKYLFENKAKLLPLYNDYVEDIKKYMGDNFVEYDGEIMYDYGVLDLEYFFWQRYGNYDKFKLDTELNFEELLKLGYKPKISPDKFEDKLIYMLDGVFNKKMMPHYYQAFSQGGYYGYDEKPFKKYLKQKDYPLDFFAGQKTVFDSSFRLAQKKFAESEMENVMFILSDTDPWSIACPIPMPAGKDNSKLILKNSSHLLKLKDFDKNTREFAENKLKSWIGEN